MFWNGSVTSHEKISEFSRQYSGDILYSMIDGHSAYCMNHGLSAKNSQLMTSDTNPKTQLSADERKLLAYLDQMAGKKKSDGEKVVDEAANKEEFEKTKKQMKRMLIGTVVMIGIIVAMAVAYKMGIMR